MNLVPKDPKPGSREAESAGCRCPVFDNAHGRGRYGDGEKYGWIVSEDCRMHWEPLEASRG